MFVDSILETILRPFREIARAFNSASNAKSSVQMDIERVRQAPQVAKMEIMNAASPIVQTGQNAASYRSQGQSQAAQPSPNGTPPTQKKKMSFWPWAKKTCIRCNQKLHKSWDQCPYCGQSQSAPVLPGAPGGQPGAAPYPPGPGAPVVASTPGGPQKTIAMDAVAINAPLVGPGDRGENVAWLVPLDGPLTGELLQIKGRSFIGTAEGSDIRVFDASISGRHAEISLGQNNRYRITDLGSRNGTYVNDKSIASVELVDGDNIRLGRTTFRFKTKA